MFVFLKIYPFHCKTLFALVVEKVGEFVLEHAVDKNTSKVKRKVKLVLTKDIIWPGAGKVPRDSPQCGFQGELCLPESTPKDDKGMTHFCSVSIPPSSLRK